MPIIQTLSETALERKSLEACGLGRGEIPRCLKRRIRPARSLRGFFFGSVGKNDGIAGAATRAMDRMPETFASGQLPPFFSRTPCDNKGHSRLRGRKGGEDMQFRATVTHRTRWGGAA